MVLVGCSFLWCTIFFVFLLSPSPMVSGRSGSYVSRRSALTNPVTSETADVPPFLLVQINFSRAGCLAEGCQHPWHPPWRRHWYAERRLASSVPSLEIKLSTSSPPLALPFLPLPLSPAPPSPSFLPSRLPSPSPCLQQPLFVRRAQAS